MHGAGFVAGETGKLGGMDCRTGGETENHLGTGSDPDKGTESQKQIGGKRWIRSAAHAAQDHPFPDKTVTQKHRTARFGQFSTEQGPRIHNVEFVIGKCPPFRLAKKSPEPPSPQPAKTPEPS